MDEINPLENLMTTPQQGDTVVNITDLGQGLVIVTPKENYNYGVIPAFAPAEGGLYKYIRPAKEVFGYTPASAPGVGYEMLNVNGDIPLEDKEWQDLNEEELDTITYLLDQTYETLTELNDDTDAVLLSQNAILSNLTALEDAYARFAALTGS